MDDRQIQVATTVAASPASVFALLADPARHTTLDGSGMLRGLDEGPRPLTRVGDAFTVDMHQDALGDYRMRNVVTEFEQDVVIAWAPEIHPHGALSRIFGDLDPCGHRFVWRLDPMSDGGTRVTHTYDWSRLRDERAASLYPVVAEPQLRGTAERLVKALAPS